MLDMASISAAVQGVGALVIWDLAHSAGAMPLHLSALNVDFAVGCGYKYLNGGPGAPAFVYVAERHQDKAVQPLTGWFGHKSPFTFDSSYQPAQGIGRQLCGTPAVISMAALEVGLDLMLEADLGLVRQKSVALCSLFVDLVQQKCSEFGFRLASPSEPSERGSQICLAHKHGYPILQALIARGVIGDFRAPDILRFGFTPLYTRFRDVWEAVGHLREVMERREWDVPQCHKRLAVT